MNALHPLSVTERTRVRRHSERARTDRTELYDVLDAGMICHFAVVRDGSPVVLPTAYGRVGDTLYLHGSSANRTLLAADGQHVSVAVTHLDGLVCARAAFSHSVNYRSAVVFGVATLVRDDAERLTALRAVTQQLIPGRWEALRSPPARSSPPPRCCPCRSRRRQSRSAPGRRPTNRTTSAPGCGRAWFPSR